MASTAGLVAHSYELDMLLDIGADAKRRMTTGWLLNGKHAIVRQDIMDKSCDIAAACTLSANMLAMCGEDGSRW
jgi:hypothetical protein